MNSEKYKAAIEMHKFYDTVSTSIVVGQITMTGVAFYIYKEIKGTPIDYYPFVGVTLCVVVLLLMYRHCAYYANVARNVAVDLELGTTTTGVSHALKNNTHPATQSWKKGIYGKVHILTAILVIGLISSALRVACHG